MLYSCTHMPTVVVKGLKLVVVQTKEDEVSQLKQEVQKVNKLREGIQRKLRDVENHKLEVEQQREMLRTQVIAMERGQLIRLSKSFVLFVMI